MSGDEHGSIPVSVGVHGYISRAVGATGQSGHPRSHREGMSSVPGGGQGAYWRGQRVGSSEEPVPAEVLVAGWGPWVHEESRG